MSASPDDPPLAAAAKAFPPRVTQSIYPEPFRSSFAGRTKRVLGDRFGLRNFGVNLTHLVPGARSALLHRHSRQDEFVYVLEGSPTLVTDEGELTLSPGDCAGFPAGGLAHQLVNRSLENVWYLEVGDRSAGDAAEYPADDLQATLDHGGTWRFSRKDGTPY